jgi:hypothetical protein
LTNFHHSRKSALQPSVLNSREILPQQRLGTGHVWPQDRFAQLRAGSSEKIEIHPVFARAAKPVDFIGDREQSEPVGIVPRYREAENCEVP